MRISGFAPLMLACAAMLPIAAPPVLAQDAPAAAAPAVTDAQSQPTLIIAISVDQFSADLFTQYRPLFTGGLARLSQAVVFPQGYQAHAATETCPGHSTILTGAHPGNNGIIANNWFDLSLARDDKRVYCSEDPTVEATSSASGRYAPSTHYLRVPTLGERMRAADPRSRVVSIAGKDRAAIMMGGRGINETWWLSPTGLASYRGTEASPAVARISAAVARAIGTARPPLELPAACGPRDYPVALGNGLTVGTGRFERAAGNFRGFLASPEADGAVLAAGAAMRAEYRLGQNGGTDLLILGLSATDYVGHTYGTEGAEMCLQMLGLDRELGDFFARMDATGIDYAVVLTADHGGHDTPERNRENAIPDAERVSMELAPAAIGSRVKAELGLTLEGELFAADAPFGDFYVNRSLSAADRTRAIDAAIRIMQAHRQVERVYRGSDIAAMPMPRRSPELWTVEERIRANYDRERSGDFIVVLKPRVTPIPDTSLGYIATHGSVWDYDRRVPILFWRRGLSGFEQPNPVMVVDIMPTLAALIGLPLTGDTPVDGRCLDLVAGTGTSCR
jgi:predicted AlkP superfamily pyrophosphatase or phosphodiesterase